MDGSEIKIKLTKWGEDLTKTFIASVSDPLAYMWGLLLQSAAGNAECKDEDLLQYIKDATDYKIDLFGGDCDDDEEDLVITEVDAHAKAGHERLVQLHAQEDKWKSLPSHDKVHKTKRAIDRRFDGPKHMRTRDFSDSFW